MTQPKQQPPTVFDCIAAGNALRPRAPRQTQEELERAWLRGALARQASLIARPEPREDEPGAIPGYIIKALWGRNPYGRRRSGKGGGYTSIGRPRGGRGGYVTVTVTDGQKHYAAKLARKRWVADALSRLPARQREALHAVLVDDLSQRAAAARMGISQPAVARLLREGKAHLAAAAKRDTPGRGLSPEGISEGGSMQAKRDKNAKKPPKTRGAEPRPGGVIFSDGPPHAGRLLAAEMTDFGIPPAFYSLDELAARWCERGASPADIRAASACILRWTEQHKLPTVCIKTPDATTMLFRDDALCILFAAVELGLMFPAETEFACSVVGGVFEKMPETWKFARAGRQPIVKYARPDGGEVVFNFPERARYAAVLPLAAIAPAATPAA